jgi:hypothetical protein
MSTSSTAIGDPARVRQPATGKRTERLFFSGMAVALAITVFAGFAPTYYLRASFASPELTWYLHLHGFAFTAWMVLLVVQTSLIAANKTAVHRSLGVFGAVLGVLMVILGVYVAIARIRAGFMASPPGAPRFLFLTLPMVGMLVVFPLLFGAALWLRRRTDFHKRLILLATLELVTAAVARLPVISGVGPVAFFGFTDLFLVAIALYDWRTLKRIHPATLWGGLLLIVSQPLRLMIGATAAWEAFGTWLIS